MKKKYIVIGLLVCLFLGSNFCWYKLLKREENRLKNVVVPTLANDYYSEQVALTNYAKKNGDYIFSLNNNYSGLNSVFYDVPFVKQNPDYPNGCEAASAVMLLNYAGVSITLKDFVEKYLPMQEVYERKGVRYGPNPSKYYAGDPASAKRGWGCFDTVIYSAIEKITGDNSYNDKKIILPNSKMPLRELALKAPAMIWITIDYKEVESVYTWQNSEGTETYTYPKNSHVVVLTGYDNEYYYINDPLKDDKNIKVLKEELEKAYDSLGRQTLYFE